MTYQNSFIKADCYFIGLKLYGLFPFATQLFEF